MLLQYRRELGLSTGLRDAIDAADSSAIEPNLLAIPAFPECALSDVSFRRSPMFIVHSL
jgi:hypothetical protein